MNLLLKNRHAILLSRLFVGGGGQSLCGKTEHEVPLRCSCYVIEQLVVVVVTQVLYFSVSLHWDPSCGLRIHFKIKIFNIKKKYKKIKNPNWSDPGDR